MRNYSGYYFNIYKKNIIFAQYFYVRPNNLK